MARRSDARDKAKAEYIRRRAVGENINLKEFAGEMGANYESLRRWKVKDGWEKDVPRKRGGQPGNTNSRKKKNAKGNKGGGAPKGNKNAEKDGAYSAVFFDALPDADKDFENSAYRKTCLRFFKLMCATPLGKICASDHAMNAVDEMSALNRDLKAFFDKNGADYPEWKALESEGSRYIIK